MPHLLMHATLTYAHNTYICTPHIRMHAFWRAGGQADPFGTAAVFDDDEEPAMVSIVHHTPISCSMNNARKRKRERERKRKSARACERRDLGVDILSILTPTLLHAGGDCGPSTQKRVQEQGGRADGRCSASQLGYARRSRRGG